jgi:hypothetical protein
MMATAHTLVAGAIAAKVGSPMLALPLALTSHFILDSIPHWDFGTNWRKRTKTVTGMFAIVDTVVGFTAAYLMFHTRVPSIVLIPSLILSVLPDWLEAPWYIFYANPNHVGPKDHASLLERLAFRLYKVTNVAHSKAPFPWGLISQILTVTFFLLLLK